MPAQECWMLGVFIERCCLERRLISSQDLLVLIFYLARPGENPEEALAFITKYTETHATAGIIERRKDPLSETEIYIHWAIFQLISNLRRMEDGLHLGEAASANLLAELCNQLSRAIALYDMLLPENRLDQICLLLQCLSKYPPHEAQPYIPPHMRRMARAMKKKRADRPTQDWHKATADRLLMDLKTVREDARRAWGRKAGARLAVGEGHGAAIELRKIKTD